MDDDRAILIGALNVAMRAYEKLNPRRTLLGTRVDESVLEPLSAAIEKCAAYQTVAGQVLFSGGSGPILHSPSLASRVFSKVQYGDDVSKAADWLLRILTTRQAKALFKAAIWGLDLSEEIALGPTTRLMPFASLHDSYMKRRILERAKPCYDKSAWISQRYFDVPLAAFVEEVPTFPYIGSDGACFREMQKLQWKAHDMSILIQGTSVGRPIAVACWFEYANQDLEYAEWENQLTWLLPEIPPYVKTNVPADIRAIRENQKNYDALPDEQHSRLLRSMDRFRLSQCRREEIDRVLDLALAFEIAVSEQGDNAPPSWKVSVRSSQLMGGPLSERQNIREMLSLLYDLRNKAAHGSTLKSKSKKSTSEIIQTNSDLFVVLMKKLLAIRLKPDWKAVELGPLQDVGPAEAERIASSS